MRPALFACLAFPLLALACGGAAKEAEAPNAAADAPPAALAAMTSAPAHKPGQLSRAEVKVAIKQGVGAFLQNVAVEDWPVMVEGRFKGFKLRAINPDWTVDLKPGDVVTKVNGMPIEHPEDADAALRSLEKASALKVDYERDGKARTFEMPIVD